MFLCCSKCFQTDMNDDESPAQQIGDVAKVQIRNNANKQIKWVADDARPDSQVSVHFSNNDQFWQLQRDKGNGFWTIHTLCDNRELFITCDPSDADARLGFDEENTSRYFNVIVAPDGGLYLLPRKTEDDEEDRFLCIVSGKLGVSPKPSIEWEIKINGTCESEHQERFYRVQLTNFKGKSWISSEAAEGEPVKVATSAAEETWVASIQTKRSFGRGARIDHVWDLAVEQARKTDPQCFLTCEQGDRFVKFRSNSASEEVKKFKVLKKSGTGALHFLTMSNLKRFVQIKENEEQTEEVLGIGEGDLKQAAQHATDWCANVVGIPIGKGMNFFPVRNY